MSEPEPELQPTPGGDELFVKCVPPATFGSILMSRLRSHATASLCAWLSGRSDVAASDAYTEKMLKEYRSGTQDIKLYRRVKLSGVAAAKILLHAKRGCDEGIAASGTPTEIMGMLFGYADTKNSGTVVITDAYEIPLAGSCHDIAPFQPHPTTGAMGQEFFYFYGEERPGGYEGLANELKRMRPEGMFCGWYHSHPFEPVSGGDHCWFSGIDVSTQTTQQTVFEKDGKPFIGLVVDPQTSMKEGRPHFGAFRCYDRGFEKEGLPPVPAPFRKNQSDKLECELSPDGSTVVNDSDMITKWGGQWNRYYRLDIEYFNSSMGTFIMRSLKQKFLWVDDLASTSTKTQSFADEFPSRVEKLNESLTSMASAVGSGPRGMGSSLLSRAGGTGTSQGTGEQAGKETIDPVAVALTTSANIARELVTDQLRSVSKSMALRGTVD